jgi:hypothetical protein
MQGATGGGAIITHIHISYAYIYLRACVWGGGEWRGVMGSHVAVDAALAEGECLKSGFIGAYKKHTLSCKQQYSLDPNHAQIELRIKTVHVLASPLSVARTSSRRCPLCGRETTRF